MASGAAKRYAQAILDLAKEQETLDAWHDDLARLNELMSNADAAAFFANPNASTAQKEAMLEQVLEKARPEARNLAALLATRGRLEIVPELYRLYLDGMRAERGIAVAEVTTAEPLGPEEQEMVRDRLSAIVDKQVELDLKVDESIIGGLIARIGDQLIDGSVISRLQRLRARLAATA